MKLYSSILAVSLLVVSSVAVADVVVNNSNKASPGTIVAKTYEKALGENTVEFYQGTNCEDADKKYQNSKNAVMIYNADVGIAALSKNLNCPMRATPAQTVFIGKSYLKICTNVKNPKTLETAKTIGAASVILSKGLIADYNSNGLSLKGVPYGGSKDVLGAIVAGDIDFGFVATGLADPAVAQGQIVCPFSTDPREADFVGKKLKLQVSTLPIVKVFYTNSTDPEFIGRLQKATGNEEFRAFTARAGYNDIVTGKVSQKDLDSVQKHITDSYNFYWK